MLFANWSLLLAFGSACIAAITDLRTRTIPNWLTLPLLPIALVAHALTQGSPAALASLVGAVACFVPVYFLFARGAVGGGDVKLFAALGALLGARDGLELELTAFALVAAFALWSMAWNGRLWALLHASFHATLHLMVPSRFARPLPGEGSRELPMGGAILCAVFALCVRSAL